MPPPIAESRSITSATSPSLAYWRRLPRCVLEGAAGSEVGGEAACGHSAAEPGEHPTHAHARAGTNFFRAELPAMLVLFIMRALQVLLRRLLLLLLL